MKKKLPVAELRFGPHKLLDLSRAPKVSAGEPYRIRRTLEYGHVAVSSEDLFMK